MIRYGLELKVISTDPRLARPHIDWVPVRKKGGPLRFHSEYEASLYVKQLTKYQPNEVYRVVAIS